MNAITNIILLILFLFISLQLRFPDIIKNNHLKSKFILFLSTFCFQMSVITIDQIIKGCKIDLTDNLKESLFMATKVLIGYSLYIDIALMNVKDGPVYKYIHASGATNHLFVVFVIISFVTVIKVVELLFKDDIDKCSSS